MAYGFPDLGVEIGDDHVAEVEIRRPPHNFFDFALIRQIADTYQALDEDPACRAIVLCADGKSFCAGANFGDGSRLEKDGTIKEETGDTVTRQLYEEAARIFASSTPVVAAVHGAAIGGGFGLAISADFRVTCPEARFAANFTRLGFHPGFGLTVTLPRLIGHQKAALVFLTSRRFKGDEAVEMGIADQIAPQVEVRTAARALAAEIAANAPLGVASTRATLRQGLADLVATQTTHELAEQTWLRKTEDFREGVAATSDRRMPVFKGV